MFDVAGHRMCKTRLKMMVSCGRLTRTTQLHPTGHHCDPDDDDGPDDDDDDDDYKDDDDVRNVKCLSWLITSIL